MERLNDYNVALMQSEFLDCQRLSQGLTPDGIAIREITF